jgi:two-component system, LuxR family, response regulator FixJ
MPDIPHVYTVGIDVAILSCLSRLGSPLHHYSSPVEFLAETNLNCPGCVVTELEMGEIGGLELQRRIRAAKSLLSFVMITETPDVPTTVAVMSSGAIALLARSSSGDDLLTAVRQGMAASRELWIKRQKEQSVETRLAQLTDEERAVMNAILADKPNKAIAQELQVSLRTVDRRRQAVMEKMQVASIRQLAAILGQLSIGNRE